jgi:anti-sigma factor RsiW
MNDTRMCDDKGALVTYLYGEANDAERKRFEAHLATCPSCAAELDALGGVRTTLAGWQAPNEALGFRLVRDPVVVPIRRKWWSAPAWAQAAAAVLLLASAAAVANLDVRYGRDGFEIRTGWQARPAESAAATTQLAAGSAARLTPAALASPAPWRDDLAALGQQLRQELASRPAPALAQPVTVSAAGLDSAQVLRLIDGRINTSEERQRRELAVGLSRVNQDFEMQRRIDLARFDRGLGQVETRTGFEATQQRQMIDYLMKVSQKK